MNKPYLTLRLLNLVVVIKFVVFTIHLSNVKKQCTVFLIPKKGKVLLFFKTFKIGSPLKMVRVSFMNCFVQGSKDVRGLFHLNDYIMNHVLVNFGPPVY